VLIAGLITGVLLYIIGSAMDHHEHSKREREWKDRWGK